MKAEPAVDIGALRREWEEVGVPGAVDEIIDAFLEHTSGQLGPLGDAVDHGDAGQAQSIAHALKSSAAAVKALPLARLFREIEAQARTGTTAHLDERVRDAVREFERVCAGLSKTRGPGSPGTPAV